MRMLPFLAVRSLRFGALMSVFVGVAAAAAIDWQRVHSSSGLRNDTLRDIY